MTISAAIVAFGASSALGRGDAAFRVPALGEAAPRCVARDAELALAGLGRPHAARVELSVPDGVDRATRLLENALADCARDLDAVLPAWRTLRVGAAIGTSSGGMRAFEHHRSTTSPGPPSGHPDMSATYIGPLLDAARPCPFEPCSLVLGACASSTLAIGVGRAWLDADRCDLVLCGGFDAVSVFVAAGFECLRATSGPLGPRPFRTSRDGLSLGEGAAIVALVPADRVASEPRRVRAWVTGFGASCDAKHLTAPDARGDALAGAVRAALADAGVPPSVVGLVSAHGTATPQNDSAEAAALVQLWPSAEVPAFALKGSIGHTLGASGALELLAAVDAMQRGVAPSSAGDGPVEPGVRILDRSEACSATTALKLSSAFGGANGALVVERQARSTARSEARAVRVSRAVSASLEDTDAARLAAETGYGADRLSRSDDLVRLAIAAVARLERAEGSLRGAGIIVGHGLATIETNARFLDRLRTAGAARGEPRRFPYTSPNAVAGECAVAFGLTGPSFAVGGGPHGGIEALGVAADLVRAGMAARMVVVVADAGGEATERIAPRTATGAIALVVGGPEMTAPLRLVAASVRLDAQRRSPVPSAEAAAMAMEAHRALSPLLDDIGTVAGEALELTVELPGGGSASARLVRA